MVAIDSSMTQHDNWRPRASRVVRMPNFDYSFTSGETYPRTGGNFFDASDVITETPVDIPFLIPEDSTRGGETLVVYSFGALSLVGLLGIIGLFANIIDESAYLLLLMTSLFLFGGSLARYRRINKVD